MDGISTVMRSRNEYFLQFFLCFTFLNKFEKEELALIFSLIIENLFQIIDANFQRLGRNFVKSKVGRFVSFCFCERRKFIKVLFFKDSLKHFSIMVFSNFHHVFLFFVVSFSEVSKVRNFGFAGVAQVTPSGFAAVAKKSQS